MRIIPYLLGLLLLVACGPTDKKDDLETAENEGEAYTGPIIDMHLHAYSQETGGFFFGAQHPPTMRGETFEGAKDAEEQKAETLKRLEKYNIVKAVVTSGELWSADAPDKIIVAKSRLPIDSLRALHETGKMQVLAEMAPFYDGVRADDTRLVPYFDLAQELKIPIGYHIFPGGPPSGLYLMGLKGMRVANANPLQIEDVLVNRPELKLYIMHGGWPYLDHMKALMYTHPQIYIDVAVISWILPEIEFHTYLKALVDAGYGKRIMFGTDQMVWPQTIDMAVAAIHSADFLTLEQKEDIFYNNAATFLGLSDEEIKQHKGNQ